MPRPKMSASPIHAALLSVAERTLCSCFAVFGRRSRPRSKAIAPSTSAPKTIQPSIDTIRIIAVAGVDPATSYLTRLYASHLMSPRTSKADSFDRVEKLGLELPGVQVSTYFGKPALKLDKEMIACMASHKSAEPNTLVVRVD